MEKKKILIVDDEENIRFLYKEELQDMGYTIELACHAEDAIIKLKKFIPDLIILDIKMPGMDGIELLNIIREKDKEIPIIMCSAYNDYKQNFKVWASDAYVVKSSDLSELKEVIKISFEKKRKKQNND